MEEYATVLNFNSIKVQLELFARSSPLFPSVISIP